MRKAIERTPQHDDKTRNLIAFRLNKAPLKVSAAATYRKGDIILVEPFDKGKSALLSGFTYLSEINGESFFLEQVANDNPAEWPDSEPGFFYSIILAGYYKLIPSDDVRVIGEVIGVKDDRPVNLVRSGFIKGNPLKRLNYKVQGHHTHSQFNRFVDICQGRTDFDKSIDAITEDAED